VLQKVIKIILIYSAKCNQGKQKYHNVDCCVINSIEANME